ncbi:MAG TPA: carbohydrate ABC transporter permease [Polyangiaceae bacterium]|nr:carbohydrate ABC transporter permease [Polyangiaceae bacterium]
MRRALQWCTVAMVLAFATGPLFSQVVTSLRPDRALGGGETPFAWSLANYRGALEGRALGRSLLNSIAVAGATTMLCLGIGSLAAFALAKLRFRGKGLWLGGALAISMFPAIATVSPLYLVIRALGLRDTLGALVLSYVTFALPLSLFLLTRFFREIPDAIYEAARVDGCTPLQAWWHVGLPLAAPGIASTAILVFIFAYNEFLYALTFTSSPEMRTVPVAISLFASNRVEPWGEIAAASVMAAVPLVLVAIVFQRRIVTALTQGAVKD